MIGRYVTKSANPDLGLHGEDRWDYTLLWLTCDDFLSESSSEECPVCPEPRSCSEPETIIETIIESCSEPEPIIIPCPESEPEPDLCCAADYFYAETSCPEGYSFAEDPEKCSYHCVPDCEWELSRDIEPPNFMRSTSGLTTWSYFHSTFPEMGVATSQVWIDNGKDGCTVSFKNQYTTDPSAFGTCEIIAGNSVMLNMHNGASYNFFYVEAFYVPDEFQPDAVARYQMADTNGEGWLWMTQLGDTLSFEQELTESEEEQQWAMSEWGSVSGYCKSGLDYFIGKTDTSTECW